MSNHRELTTKTTQIT